MVEVSNIAPKAEEPRKQRSWLGLALGASLAAHAGLAAMLWVEQPPQPEAGAVFNVEVVSAAGAANAVRARSGASSTMRGAGVAKPEAAPEPRALSSPDAPRAARAAPREARPPHLSPAVPAPERAAAARRDSTALRPPARIPPPPAKAPRLAAAPARGSARTARPQTASVPIVAADAPPGAAAPSAGPEGPVTPPRYGFGSAANPIPRYPALARENGWEGVVMLVVQVGAGGEALGVSIAKSSGHGLLDASAVDAVRRWRFAPARRAGMPVAGTATVPIRFRLED